MEKNLKWNNAQSEELLCWKHILYKLNNPLYIKLKKKYWRLILRKAGLDPENLKTKSIIEIGSGPSGIFLLFPEKRDFTIVDPLINEYLKLVPFLNNKKYNLINKTLEKINFKKTYDFIFAINCIDHTYNILKFINKLNGLCDPESIVIIAVNCHNSKWSEFI
jgi:hypothetical protein